MEKKRREDLVVEPMELEVVEFTDLEQLEESIAPIFLLAADTGGTCSGGAGSGCICKVAT
jgi:hypothetical protein